MDIPDAVPVMTLPSATLFPQALLPLYIFEPRYRRMLADALKAHRMFIVAMQKPGQTREIPCPVAGLGLIRVSVDHQDGTSHLILQGLSRVELRETVRYRPYRVQQIRLLRVRPADNVVIDALLAKVLELVRERLETAPFPFPFPLSKRSYQADPGPSGQPSTPSPAHEILDYLESLGSADQMVDLISCALLPRPFERQIILETIDLESRLKRLVTFLMAEIRRQKTA